VSKFERTRSTSNAFDKKKKKNLWVLKGKNFAKISLLRTKWLIFFDNESNSDLNNATHRAELLSLG